MSDFKWHPMDWDDTSELKNHNYYLVTHKRYGTPMKAKWHDEEVWEVLGGTRNNPDGSVDYDPEFWHWYDEDCPITAWMKLPECYKEETDHD